MTMHLGFLNLILTVTYAHNIHNYMREAKMTPNSIYKLVNNKFTYPQQILRT